MQKGERNWKLKREKGEHVCVLVTREEKRTIFVLVKRRERNDETKVKKNYRKCIYMLNRSMTHQTLTHDPFCKAHMHFFSCHFPLRNCCLTPPDYCLHPPHLHHTILFLFSMHFNIFLHLLFPLHFIIFMFIRLDCIFTIHLFNIFILCNFIFLFFFYSRWCRMYK